MKSKKSIKDFVWNAVGLTLNAFNSLFFLIVVRYINGMDEAGIFTYAFSLCCLFYVFACFFNRTFQIINESDKYSFSDFLSARLIFSGGTLILILVFAIINGFSLLKIMTIVLLMVFRAIEAISECIYGEMQKEDKLYKTGVSLTLKAISGLALFALIDYFTKDMLLGVVGIILANVLIFIFYDGVNFRKIAKEKFVFSTKNVGQILKISMPVMIFTALGAYLANCPKYFMTYFESNEMQTIFGILVMPASVLSLASSYLINPFVAKLDALKKEKELGEFKKTTISIVSIMAGIGALAVGVCYVIGIPVLNFIYNLELGEYKSLLILAVIAAVFYAISGIISNFLTILDENKKQTVIYAITSVIATVLTFLFTMSSGMSGAVWAYLAGGVVLMFGYVIVFIWKTRKAHLH